MPSGQIEKMGSRLAAPVEYHLPIGDEAVALNPLLGLPHDPELRRRHHLYRLRRQDQA